MKLAWTTDEGKIGIFFSDEKLWTAIARASSEIEPVFWNWDFSEADVFDGGIVENPKYFPGIYVSSNHAFAWKTVLAAKEKYPDLLVLWIDAHADVKKEGEERETVARRLIEAGVDIVFMGLRAVDPYEKEFLEGKGVFYDLLPFQTSRPVFISLDVDVFDPAYMPAVVWPEAGGISPRDFFLWLQNSSFPLIGADVTEYQPDLDTNGICANLVARIVEILATFSFFSCSSARAP